MLIFSLIVTCIVLFLLCKNQKSCQPGLKMYPFCSRIKKDLVAKEIKPCEIKLEKINLQSLKLSPNSKSSNTYKTRPCEFKLRKLDLDDLVLSPNSKSTKDSPRNNNTLPQNNRQNRTSNRNRIKNPHYYDEEWIT